MRYLRSGRFTVLCLSLFAIVFATAICKNGWSQSLEQSAETQPDPGAKDPSDLPRSGEISLKIDALVTPLAKSNNYAGNVLVANGEKVFFSRSYGKTDIEKDLDHDLETRFFLRSASMIFTSTAILKLVDEGKLSLQAPLSKFLPEFKRANEITIHHMLAQRSGIPAIGSQGGIRRALLLKYTHKPHSPNDLVDYVLDYDLLFEPEEEYNHGKSEYNILAYIIEKVTGLSYGEYLEEAIFRPLGMKNSGHFGKKASNTA